MYLGSGLLSVLILQPSYLNRGNRFVIAIHACGTDLKNWKSKIMPDASISSKILLKL